MLEGLGLSPARPRVISLSHLESKSASALTTLLFLSSDWTLTLKAKWVGLTPHTPFLLGYLIGISNSCGQKMNSWFPPPLALLVVFPVFIKEGHLHLFSCLGQKPRRHPEPLCLFHTSLCRDARWFPLHSVSRPDCFSPAPQQLPWSRPPSPHTRVIAWASCLPTCLCVTRSPPSHETGFLKAKSDGLTLLLQNSSSSRLKVGGLGDGAHPAPLTCLHSRHAGLLARPRAHRNIPPRGPCSCGCPAPGSP